ncbi:hypothetical protein [Algiphilus sp.]|uniref:OmpP1/FadL family transporter n=1 Tax=Algiphilus sp. TaxID=1872431 RepID=UPI0025BA9539|nr:hypothetical protein [Algiphilus sp.]MCK5771160.1 hypothetical protein [Algiphilus sp.]
MARPVTRAFGPLAGALLALAATQAQASLIVSPHTATRDADLAGAAGASPDDAGSASLTNPAGVVGPLSGQIVVGVAAVNFTAHYQDRRRDFDQTSSETPMFLNLWYGLGELAGWHMGIGAYGSVGTAFEFAADGGQDTPFLGKLALFNVGFLVGRQITPDLRVGLQIAPNYAEQSVKLPSPLGPVEFDGLKGAGIDGAVGLVYDASEKLSLGLSYRTRGYTRLEGDGRVGATEQDLVLDLYTPQSVTAAFDYEALPGLHLMGQSKWTRYEDFESGRFDFEKSDPLDQPYIANTTNRFRHWLAVEYTGLSNRVLRIGYTAEPWMIEGEAMRPTLFDTADYMLMLGYEIQHENYNIGFTYGYTGGRQRDISAEQNPDFAGSYHSEIRTGFGVHFTWKP